MANQGDVPPVRVIARDLESPSESFWARTADKEIGCIDALRGLDDRLQRLFDGRID